jgi:hypothetical protein
MPCDFGYCWSDPRQNLYLIQLFAVGAWLLHKDRELVAAAGQGSAPV